MSEEVKETEDKGVPMYVHQVDWDVILKILSSVTDVNRVYTYSMPNKAESYASNGFEMINVINSYIDTDESWRIDSKSNVRLVLKEDKIEVGDWIITGSKLNMCIPTINSIIIIPDENSTIRGAKDPTKIIQLTNCISVMPLLVKLLDERDENDADKFILGMSYEIIIPNTENEKPS
jgi:hypothetical protein